MAQVQFENICISGIAASVPKNIIVNESFADLLGEDIVSRVVKTTGIRCHRKALRRQTAGDLAYVATEHLMTELAIERNDIGAVVYITTTPDYMVPATAFVIHKRLGLTEECIAFDINLSCAGFVYGLQILGSIMQNMKTKYALLINGNAPKHLEVADRKNPDHSALMMFGDAATVTLLECTKKGEAKPLKISLNVDSSKFKMLCTLGGCRCPDASREVSIWSDGKEHSLFDAGMDGIGVFSFSTTRAPESIRNFLKNDERSVDDYDKVFLHQANKMIVDRIVKIIKADPEKCHISLDRFGNTSSCSIPLGIVDAYGNMKEKKEQNLLMCGFGSGLAWGTASCYIEQSRVLPLIESDEIYLDGEVQPF